MLYSGAEMHIILVSVSHSAALHSKRDWWIVLGGMTSQAPLTATLQLHIACPQFSQILLSIHLLVLLLHTISPSPAAFEC